MITSPATRLVAALLLGPVWVVALAMLLKGHTGAGDGFSAGLIAGAGVLLHEFVLGAPATRRLPPVAHARGLVAGGLLLVLAAVFGPMLAGRPPLEHYPAPGEPAPHFGVLSLHTGFGLEVGVFLLVFGFVLAAVRLLGDALERGEGR